jgi:hypothetical protein
VNCFFFVICPGTPEFIIRISTPNIEIREVTNLFNMFNTH